MTCTNLKYDRRSFLVKSMKISAAMCLSCALPTVVTPCSQNKNDDVSPKNYYISQKAKHLKAFDNLLTGPGQTILARSMSDSDARKILADARDEFESILPQIPYIGGDENDNSTNQLVGAAQSLSLYRILISRGKSINEIGQIIYDIFKAYLYSSPQIVVSIYGYFKFHVGRDQKMKSYSEMSLKRKYPMDFVYTFIEGDGKDLYYGNDMIECAIQKFLTKENAEELMPYICACDYPLSKRFNRGLIRTKTLVESNVCDFRYGIDRETQINLPPGLKV